MQVHPLERLPEFSSLAQQKRLAVDSRAGIFVVWEPSENPASPTLEQAQQIAESRIYAGASQEFKVLSSRYNGLEQIRWPEKELEARAYQLSQNDADAPTLAQEAELSEIPLSTLAQTVLTKAAQLREAELQIVAKRKRLCNQISASTDIGTINQIQWTEGN